MPHVWLWGLRPLWGPIPGTALGMRGPRDVCSWSSQHCVIRTSAARNQSTVSAKPKVPFSSTCLVKPPVSSEMRGTLLQSLDDRDGWRQVKATGGLVAGEGPADKDLGSRGERE